jgi:hypothetical protein
MTSITANMTSRDFKPAATQAAGQSKTFWQKVFALWVLPYKSQTDLISVM